MSTAAKIAVLDYGAGNLRSVAKALERSEFEVRVSSDPGVVKQCDALVLPGVGAFADGMKSLRERGLDAAVVEATLQGRPYLGLCLGLQLLFDEGEEHGVTPGLGLMRGRVERFPEHDVDGMPLCVPHIGWNEVVFSGDHPMIAALPERDHFYFVHSYRPVPTDPAIIAGRTRYGGEFASAIAKENVFAVQFHPEKSQAAGKRLLDAFRQWVETTR
jgi:glutamine amidotransferase